MIALMLALLVQPAEAPPFGAQWGHVQADGWTPLVGDDRSLALHREAAGPHQVWLRLEYAQPNEGVRSEQALFEVDCAARQLRITEMSTYAEPNLVGLIETSDQDSPWLPIQPDTNFDRVAALAC